MLIEKAYAKLFGSYQRIEQGLTGVGLNALTGAPFEYLNKDRKEGIDVEVAWTFITSNFELNHLLVGSTENNDRNGYLGLVSEHAYTILDAQEVHIATKKGKKKERILKMENPWGKYEWKGRDRSMQDGGRTTLMFGARS
jgi:calpain-15